MPELTLLPLDLKGNRLTHRFNREPHTLIKIPNRPDRVILPNQGGFYAAYLKVYDNAGRVLTRNVDYKLTYLYPDLSRMTGQQINALIVITNTTVSANVTIDYRAVGGAFGLSAVELKEVLESLADNPKQFEFDAIITKPSEYPAAPHTHEFWQIYGMENTLGVLSRVRDAILVGDTSVTAYEQEYADTLLENDRQTLDEVVAQVEAHLGNFANPHADDRASIGLDLLNNYPAASEEEAIGLGANNRYMTVLRTFNAINSVALPTLRQHLIDFTNPHNTTATQVGSFTETQMRELTESKLPVDGTAYNANLLDGRTYVQVRAAVRANLPAGSITTGVFAPGMLGTGTTSVNHMLVGTGQWRHAADLFQEYLPPTNATYYIGLMGTDDNALQHIAVTYANIQAYPVGTVILYVVTMDYYVPGGNGGLSYSVNQLSAAIRAGSGWTSM